MHRKGVFDIKKLIALAATAALLCAVLAPASAVKWDPQAPDSPAPDGFTQALEDYELNEAIRLGLVPPTLQSDYDQAITRAELAQAVLTLAAVRYNYDLPGFLDVCTIAPPPRTDGTAPQYTDSLFSDAVGSDIIHWAYALGLMSGKDGDVFDPQGPVTRQDAALVLHHTAQFCHLTPGASAIPFTDADLISDWAIDSVTMVSSLGIMGGVGDGRFAPLADYTRRQCFVTLLRIYHLAGGSDTPLLPYTQALQRAVDTFSSLELQRECAIGTVLYGLRGEQYALSVVYSDGGGREIPLPAESLAYIPNGTFAGLLSVYASDGRMYELDLRTGASTPIATAGELAIGLPAEDQLETDEHGHLFWPRNEFGGAKQDVKLINQSAAPHTVHNGFMPVYSNDGGTWSLQQSDQVLIRVSAERSEYYPAGQWVEVGYTLNGTATAVESHYLLGETTFTIYIDEPGDYQFYLKNKSLDTLYITAFRLDVFQREDHANG